MLGVYACNIQKDISFKGGMENVGNTYHHEVDDTTPPGDAVWADLVNTLVLAESAWLPNEVKFTRATVWGPTDGPTIDNVIQFDTDPAGDGDITGVVIGTYRTVAALMVWELPRSPVLNRRRWLRKFMRPVDAFIQDAGARHGVGPIPATTIQQMEGGYGANVTELALPNGPAFLCTSQGVRPISPPSMRAFVTTRQITR
jgi:hypothetical protein